MICGWRESHRKDIGKWRAAPPRGMGLRWRLGGGWNYLGEHQSRQPSRVAIALPIKGMPEPESTSYISLSLSFSFPRHWPLRLERAAFVVYENALQESMMDVNGKRSVWRVERCTNHVITWTGEQWHPVSCTANANLRAHLSYTQFLLGSGTYSRASF